MNLFEDGKEETEEERKERQAQNAAAAAGLALGATAALIQQALRKENTDEDPYDNPDDDEGQGFDISL